MSKKKRGKGDVEWHHPEKLRIWLGKYTAWRGSQSESWGKPRKPRPLAYSTAATSDMIVALAAEGGTIREIRESINYDAEARAILDKYIEAGYGHTIANSIFG